MQILINRLLSSFCCQLALPSEEMSPPPQSCGTTVRRWARLYHDTSEHTSGAREACKLILPFKTVDKCVSNTSEGLQHDLKQFVLS